MGQDNILAGYHPEVPASDYYIICDRWDHIQQGCGGLILGKIPAINMLFLLLLNIYNNK